MSKLNDRPLNKAEQKLFVKLYTASLLSYGIRHNSLSEKEDDDIQEEVELLIEKLIGRHQSFATTEAIVDYIKGLRK